MIELQWESCDCGLSEMIRHALTRYLVVHAWWPSGLYCMSPLVADGGNNEVVAAFQFWLDKHDYLGNSHPVSADSKDEMICYINRSDYVLEAAALYETEHVPNWDAILDGTD